jgi:putative intracellular protease/amidase
MTLEIAIPLYDRFTALDAVGPYEVLSRLPGARVQFVAAVAGPVSTDNGMLSLVASASLEDVPAPDVIVVPGGIGTRALLEDEELLGWIRAAHAGSQFTTSVCTGSLLLAAAGLLDGVDATTHWLATELLGTLGARPVAERVVERGKILTAAGVSAGIDMALTLAARIAGEEVAQVIQLYIEYAPEPPFASGSLEQAPASVIARAREYAAASAVGRSVAAG